MKISFVSLGCDKNLVDSEIMLGLIDEGGHTIISDSSEADIIIINTCGFIMDATEEGIDTILELASYKKDGKCSGLIVTGCMAERYREQIFEELPEVDAVVGVGDFQEIVQVIDRVSNNEKVTLITDSNKRLSETLSHKRILSTAGHFAYLKIAEGCDNHCTYCTIPSIRGKFRSRTMESLVEEARILVAKGVRELIIVAQDTALYGTDIYGEKRLHILLQQLKEIEELQWIRLMYCYPEHIYDELIEEMASNDKVCNYIDMPIQHSNDKILKLMGRRSNESQLREVIKKLRDKVSGITIRTTLIVGFPYESNVEFDSLKNFVEDIKFDRLGVFSYSMEEGTPAARMDNQVDDDVKEQRKNIIMDIQKNISMEKCNNTINNVYNCIVDGKLPEENVYIGRTYMDCYDVDGMVFFNSPYEVMTGDFVKVKITSASDYDLIGEIVYDNEFTK